MNATLTYFKILIFSSLLGSLNFVLPIPATYFGFNLSGWAWILVLIVSVYYILSVVKKSFFTYKIWFPWVFLLFVYLVLNFSLVGLQGTVQFVVPLLVGYVAGGLKYNTKTISKIITYFKYLIIITLLSTSIFSFIRFGFFGFGPATDAHLAAISGVLALSFYYSTKKVKYMLYYGCAILIPVLATTRMGILVLLIIPLVHFYKLISIRKLIIILLLIPVGLFIFNLPSVQEKMFFNGKGELSDIEYSSKDFNTSGRSLINDVLVEEFVKSPFFGHGSRADYFLFQNKGWKLKEAHNDYLQILFCYGVLGMLIFLSTLVLQLRKLFKLKIISNIEKLIRATLFTLVPVLLLFMATDTIIRLSYSFVNYFFALIGVLLAINNQNLKINKYNNDNNSSYSFI